jgi:hypothetical protein
MPMLPPRLLITLTLAAPFIPGKALRHADINVTNNIYTDFRARVRPGLGKLFADKTAPDARNPPTDHPWQAALH